MKKKLLVLINVLCLVCRPMYVFAEELDFMEDDDAYEVTESAGSEEKSEEKNDDSDKNQEGESEDNEIGNSDSEDENQIDEGQQDAYQDDNEESEDENSDEDEDDEDKDDNGDEDDDTSSTYSYEITEKEADRIYAEDGIHFVEIEGDSTIAEEVQFEDDDTMKKYMEEVHAEALESYGDFEMEIPDVIHGDVQVNLTIEEDGEVISDVEVTRRENSRDNSGKEYKEYALNNKDKKNSETEDEILEKDNSLEKKEQDNTDINLDDSNAEKKED